MIGDDVCSHPSAGPGVRPSRSGWIRLLRRPNTR